MVEYIYIILNTTNSEFFMGFEDLEDGTVNATWTAHYIRTKKYDSYESAEDNLIVMVRAGEKSSELRIFEAIF